MGHFRDHFFSNDFKIFDPRREPLCRALASTNHQISQQEAILLAVDWAGGASTPMPGGFYDASDVKADWVKYVSGPVPYYLVHMKGRIGNAIQSLYAAVLEDGQIVRPLGFAAGSHSANK